MTDFPSSSDSQANSPLDPENQAAGLQMEVRLFAAAADLAATRQVQLRVAPGCSLHEVRRQLTDRYPALQVLAGVSRWAVDEQFVSDDFILRSPATIAMIPPVSGG